MDSALAHVKAAISAQPGWRELLPRLAPDVAPAAQSVWEHLQASG
jgi:hypothetical protein